MPRFWLADGPAVVDQLSSRSLQEDVHDCWKGDQRHLQRNKEYMAIHEDSCHMESASNCLFVICRTQP